MTAAAALLSAVAVLFWRPPGRWLTRHRLELRSDRAFRPSLVLAPAIGLGILGVAFADLSAARLMLALTFGGTGTFAMRQLMSERRRRHAMQHREAVTESVSLMAAELRAGILPQRVIAGLAPDFTFLAPAARAADLGGDVAAALMATGSDPGGELLADVAAAWFVSERSGAPLAQVLDRLEMTARADREVDREVQAGVAPARATGRLMAVLPLVGLSLGSGMGADPLAILTDTVPGALCLAAGSALACAGVAWVNRIAFSAEAAR